MFSEIRLHRISFILLVYISCLKKIAKHFRKNPSETLVWLELMPGRIKEGDMSKKPAKEELKKWIKHTIPVRGDRILWGQSLVGDQRRRRARGEHGPQDPGGGATEEDQRQGEGEAGPDPGPTAEVVATSAEEGRETEQLVGILQRRKHRVGPKRSKVRQCEGVGVQTRWKEAAGREGLPCSRAAVVTTSPQGSRETVTTRARQTGDRGKVKDSGAAKLFMQACLTWGLRWGEDRGSTRDGLDWRKGVG